MSYIYGEKYLIMSEEYLFHVSLVHPVDNESDFYFGSIASMFEVLGFSYIGVAISTLYNYQRTNAQEWTYHNQKCTIKKRVLIRKKQSK